MPRIALLAVFLIAAPLMAAEPAPREQVLRLVPPESAVCFVVQNLRDRAKIVADSPFAEWATGKLGAALGEKKEAKQLKQFEDFIKLALGVSIADIRDDILGDTIAFAYQPGPPGKPEEERGVVLLYARDSAKLGDLIGKLNEIQKSSNELKDLVERRHRDRVYLERSHGANASEFYFIHGHLFAFSAHEDAIQAIIDREIAPPESPVLKTLNDLKLQDAFLACWLNPRKLDADLAASATANPAEKAGRAQMAKLWSAVDQCAIYLAAGKDLELGVSMTYRAEALPPELKSQFSAAPMKSPLWSAIPKNAILAIAGDAEVNAVLDIIGSFLPPEERPNLRKQIEKDLGAVVGAEKLPAVLAGLGPEAGVWAVNSPKEGGPLPSVTAVVRVKDEPDPTVPSRVLQTLGFFVQMFVYDYNRKHADNITLTPKQIGNLSATVLTDDKLFPRGISPAFVLKDGFLVLVSHPDAIAAFTAPSRAEVAKPGDVPLARLSGTALREQITNHRDDLAALLAGVQSRVEADVLRDLDTVAMVLEAFERVEVLVRGDSRSRTFAVRIQLVKPLQK